MTDPSQPEPWRSVAGAFGSNLVAFGVLFSFGVVLTPLAETFGTTTGPVAGIFSGAVFVYYLGGVVGGRLSDRHGVRPVAATGAVCLAVGLLLTSVSSSVGWAWISYVPLVGVGVGLTYAPTVGGVGREFDSRRSLAISLVLAGVATGTLVGPPLFRRLIDTYGWQDTFRGVAVVGFVVMLLGAFAFSPTSLGASTAAPTETVPIRTLAAARPFRMLYASVVVISPGFYAPLVFLNDYAIDRDIAASRASLLIGMSGAFSLLVRLTLGVVGDRMEALRRYQASYLLMTAALAVWIGAGGSYALLAVCALLHGAGWAVWVTAAPAVLAEWFGVAQLGGLVGLFYTGLGFGGLLGPVVTGFIIDSWGYETAVAAALVTSFVASGLTFVGTVAPWDRATS